MFLGGGVLGSNAGKEQAVLEAVAPEVNSVFGEQVMSDITFAGTPYRPF